MLRTRELRFPLWMTDNRDGVPGWRYSAHKRRWIRFPTNASGPNDNICITSFRHHSPTKHISLLPRPMASSRIGLPNTVPYSTQSRSQSIIIRSISGTVPGLLDPSQPSRILRNPIHKLSFASFDLTTAITSSDISDLLKLSIDYELCGPKRMVIETTVSGENFWSFVRNAKREEGCVDEGIWPRVVEICG